VKPVKIVHPLAGESYVPPSAVPHWEASGWSPADETPKADQADQADQDPPADPAPDQTAPSSRRRAPHKEGE
jgi:hypothetical protein